jgi:6,7-dimethyl-8-ribityllumazine synthase
MFLRKKLQIGVVTAKFNSLITSKLREGAIELLMNKDILETQLSELSVPGSFELPLGAQFLFEKQEVDAVICLGAVIQGETDHYDYVCSGVTQAIMQVQLQYKKPVGFGVLTCQTMEQALNRVGGKCGHKGMETAEAVLQMIEILKGN